MTSEVNSIIDNLCQKLGTATEQMIPEMARYSIATDIVVLILCLTAMVVLAVLTKKLEKQRDEGNEYGDDVEFGILIYKVFSWIFVVPIIIVITDAVRWLASPRASFFRYIISKLGGS